jgi:hypothetical protein
MNKLLLFLAFAFILQMKLFAQNLVSNPKFEEFFNCPAYNNYQLYNNLYFWKSQPVSTGYLNICSPDNEPYWLTTNAPNSAMGYQLPLSGNGYIGLYATSSNKGFAYQKLKSNLIPQKKYWVEYYWSLGDSSNYAVKSLGATFTLDTLNLTNPETPEFTRPFKLLNTNNFLEDKIRWTPINWIFEADSSYQTLLLGYGKFSTYESDTLFVGSSCYYCSWGGVNYYSFYLLENVGVYPIISNNQTLQPCTFPQVLQGPVGNDIWFREWKKDTTVLSANINQAINQAGTYTLTWRTDTTVHIDTFWVEAFVPISNFLGQDTAWQSGNSITLTAPNGFSYLWNTGSNTQNIVVDTTGIFSVVVTNTFDCAYTDSVVVFNPLGLEEVIDKLEAEIYPNPAKENINIKSTEPNCTIEIYASDGKMVLHQKLVNSPTINVTEWQQGIYYIKFYSEHGTKIPVVRKMVVQK